MDHNWKSIGIWRLGHAGLQMCSEATGRNMCVQMSEQRRAQESDRQATRVREGNAEGRGNTEGALQEGVNSRRLEVGQGVRHFATLRQ